VCPRLYQSTSPCRRSNYHPGISVGSRLSASGKRRQLRSHACRRSAQKELSKRNKNKRNRLDEKFASANALRILPHRSSEVCSPLLNKRRYIGDSISKQFFLHFWCQHDRRLVAISPTGRQTTCRALG